MFYGFDKFRRGDGYYYYGVNRHTICQAAYNYARRHGWKFITRSNGKSVLIERVA